MSTTAPDERITTYNPVVPTTEFPALFPIFANNDLSVYLDGVERFDFTVTASYVEGVSNNAKVIMNSGVTGSVVIAGERDPRRQNRFLNGGPLPIKDMNLAFDALEGEMQEARRDIERSVRSEIGRPGFILDPNLADGETLMKQGDRLVPGPNIVAIGNAATESAASARTSEKNAAISANAAIAAAEVSGNVAFFDTYADASAAVINLPNLQIVRVLADETKENGGTFYRLESGLLVFKQFVESFQPDIPESLRVPFLQKMRENVSALDPMGRAGLASAIRHSEVTDVDASEITENLKDVADQCAAKGWALHVPSGKYRLNDKIRVEAPLSICGEAMEKAVLTWVAGALNSGIEIAPTVPVMSEVRDVALKTLQVAQGKALKFDYSGLIDGGFIVPRARNLAKVSRTLIEGATSYVDDGWENGIEFLSCLSTTVDSCRINGYYPQPYGSMPLAKTGIAFHGLGNPAAMVVSNSWLSAWEVGAYTADAEGMYFTQNEFVSVGVGLRSINAAMETAVVWSGGHIAALQKCIELQNISEFFVGAGAVLFPIGPQTGDFIGVHLRDGCVRGIISGVHFDRSNITSLYRGVVVDSGTGIGNLIEANVFGVGSSDGCVGIDVLAGATAPEIGKNSYPNAFRRINNASGQVINLPPTVLAQSAAPIAHTGTTSSTVKVSIPVPTDAMGANGRLRITVALSFSNNANNKILGVWLGGGSLATATRANIATDRLQFEIANRGARNSQVVTSNFGGTSFAFTVGSIDTRQSQNLELRCQLANAGDTMTIESYLVEVLPAA